MNYELSSDCRSLLEKYNINFKKADLKQLDKIIEIYSERMQWFKDKGIKQWSKYLENHPKSEFAEVISKGYYFILEKEDKIIAGFEISADSTYWNDNEANAYYIYKLVVKVGNKKIGNIIFDICKDIAKTNNKEYLRLNCESGNLKLNDMYENHNFKFIRKGFKGDYYYSLRQCKIGE